MGFYTDLKGCCLNGWGPKSRSRAREQFRTLSLNIEVFRNNDTRLTESLIDPIFFVIYQNTSHFRLVTLLHSYQ